MTALISTAKTSSKSISKLNSSRGNNSACTLLPWTHELDHGCSAIKAYVMAAGKIETIATINQTGTIDAEKIGSFILKAVNQYDEMKTLIETLVNALEMCCTKNNLEWKIQHLALMTIARVREAGLTAIAEETRS